MTDCEPLLELPKLEDLLIRIPVSLDPICKMTKLKKLCIECRSDIRQDPRDLAPLTNLESLSVEGGLISDVQWVVGMKQLKELYLCEGYSESWEVDPVSIDDLSPLLGLEHLEKFSDRHLRRCGYADFF